MTSLTPHFPGPPELAKSPKKKTTTSLLSKQSWELAKACEVEELRYEDPEASAKLARDFLAEAPSKRAQIALSAELASSLRAIGKLKIAEKILTRCLAEPTDPALKSELLRKLAIVECQQMTSSALATARWSVAEAAVCGEGRLLGRSLSTLGLVLHKLGQIRSSTEAYLSTLNLPVSKTTKFLTCLALFHNSQLLDEDGSEFVEAAQKLGRDHRFWHLATWINGERLLASENWVEAGATFSALKAEFARRNEPRDEALAGVLAVQAFCRQGELAAAQEIAAALSHLCLRVSGDQGKLATVVQAAIFQTSELLAASLSAEIDLRKALERPRAKFRTSL